ILSRCDRSTHRFLNIVVLSYIGTLLEADRFSDTLAPAGEDDASLRVTLDRLRHPEARHPRQRRAAATRPDASGACRAFRNLRQPPLPDRERPSRARRRAG